MDRLETKYRRMVFHACEYPSTDEAIKYGAVKALGLQGSRYNDKDA